MLNLDINNELEASVIELPCSEQFQLWLETALSFAHNTGLKTKNSELEISLSLVSIEQIQHLNAEYRHKNKPTNVLSFPTDFPEELCIGLLGDIIICAEVVKAEAKAQNKDLFAHWAHMSIHGCLHLLGFDHIEEQEAEAMEALEVRILQDLGIENPYLV